MTPSNLIPGSIWERARKGEPSYSLVLCVTNEGLSQNVLEKHPQQVVFVTDQGKVLSMGISEFAANRSYYNFNAKAAEMFDNLINPPEEDEELDEEDAAILAEGIDNVSPDETLFVSDAGPATEESAEDDVVDSSPSVMRINVGPHPIADLLQANLVGYSESPFHTGDTLHTLKFTLGSGLTLANIRDAFKVSDPNAVQKFELETATETFQVDIDGFVDVMLEADSWITYGCLYITSEGDFRSPVDLVITEQQVATQPTPVTVSQDDSDLIDLSVQTAAPAVIVS